MHGDLKMSVTAFNFNSTKKKTLQQIALNQTKLRAIVRQFGFLILKSAQERTPVDTGRLKKSEKVKFENSGMTAFIFSNVHYAPIQEFVTWFHHDVGEWGFFRKSLRDYEKPFIAAIHQALKN
ncbi:MAG: HK97 gp10 family phage protein [archaeon]